MTREASVPVYSFLIARRQVVSRPGSSLVIISISVSADLSHTDHIWIIMIIITLTAHKATNGIAKSSDLLIDP